MQREREREELTASAFEASVRNWPKLVISSVSPKQSRILEVERMSTVEDIKRSYRRLARRLHPDVVASQQPNATRADIDQATHKFVQLKLAYDVRVMLATRSPFTCSPLSSLFSSFHFGALKTGAV